MFERKCVLMVDFANEDPVDLAQAEQMPRQFVAMQKGEGVNVGLV